MRSVLVLLLSLYPLPLHGHSARVVICSCIVLDPRYMGDSGVITPHAVRLIKPHALGSTLVNPTKRKKKQPSSN